MFERKFDSDRVINEYKTTASGVSRRLLSLKRSRQGKGYVACLRMVPGGERITGFMGVVILVAVESVECDRDYFPVSPQTAEGWTRQTINIVAEWRQKLRRIEEGESPLDVMVENDEECFSYGQCTFYNLCQYGYTWEELQEMSVDEWNPLDFTKETPQTIVVDAHGDVATGVKLWQS